MLEKGLESDFYPQWKILEIVCSPVYCIKMLFSKLEWVYQSFRIISQGSGGVISLD